MTSDEWKEFSQIAALCRGGNYNSINVASKIRSAAIVAAYEFIRAEFEKRTFEENAAEYDRWRAANAGRIAAIAEWAENLAR